MHSLSRQLLARRQMGHHSSFRLLSSLASPVNSSQTASTLGPRDHYSALVDQGHISHDRAQLRVVRGLQRVHESLEGYTAPNVSLLEVEAKKQAKQNNGDAGGEMAKSVRDMFKVSMSLSVGMVARSIQAAKSVTGADSSNNSVSVGAQEDGSLKLTRGQLFSRPDLVAVDGVLYDLKSFAPNHPGGAVIKGTGGTDATTVFYEMHPEFVIKRAKRKLEEYRVGTLVAGDDDESRKIALVDPHALFPKGMYIHGGAGCGKTFIMDLFFDTLQTPLKRRVHFHRFMMDVHKRLHTLKQNGTTGTDVFLQLADETREKSHVLCLDELMVTDVADALIMKQLFHALWKSGVVVVATSNRDADDLYKNGMQRQLFMPFIDQLKDRCKVVQLKSDTDYRALVAEEAARTAREMREADDRQGKQSGSFFVRSDPREPADVFIKSWDKHARTPTTDDTKDGEAVAEISPFSMFVHGREVIIPEANVAKRVGRLPFEQLCCDSDQPMATSDFLELVEHFDTLFIDQVPVMKISDTNTVRRFISLVDVAYDQRVLLVIDALTSITELLDMEGATNESEAAALLKKQDDIMGDEYLAQATHDLDNPGEAEERGDGASIDEVFAFARAVSRLHEMQSHKYLHSATAARARR